jgi:hypothetical protein
MKKTLLAAFFGLALLAAPATSQAHNYDRDDSDYPLRYVAYAVHPIGIAVEYTVLRPIHWLVARPVLNVVFGHDSTIDEPDCDYFEWE